MMYRVVLRALNFPQTLICRLISEHRPRGERVKVQQGLAMQKMTTMLATVLATYGFDSRWKWHYYAEENKVRLRK